MSKYHFLILTVTKNNKLFNRFLLTFKIYVHKNRDREIIELSVSINEIRSIKTIKNRLAVNDSKKLDNNNKIWEKTDWQKKIFTNCIKS